MTVQNASSTEAPGGDPHTEEANVWIPFVEPVPDWDEAEKTYGIWWNFHIYLVAVLFILVAIYTLINMVYLCNLYRKGGFKNVQQIAYFITISVLMLIFSFERALFMLLDAYNIGGTLPPLVAYLFISIGLPCMTSCFFLIFHAFYKASRSRLAGKSIFSIKALVAVIVVHFGFSLTLDIAAGFNFYPTYLLLICQSIFVACGITFSIMFIVIFIRMYRKSVSQRRKMIRIASGISQTSEKPSTDGHDSGENPEASDLKRTQNSLKNLPQPKVTIGGRLILVSAILLILVSILYLYGIIGIFVKHAMTGEDIDLWMWWSWEFSARILEVCLCWTISLAGTQPLMRGFRKIRSSKKRRQQDVQLVWRERRASEALSIKRKISKVEENNANKNIKPEEVTDKARATEVTERRASRVSFLDDSSLTEGADSKDSDKKPKMVPQHETLHEAKSFDSEGDPPAAKEQASKLHSTIEESKSSDQVDESLTRECDSPNLKSTEEDISADSKAVSPAAEDLETLGETDNTENLSESKSFNPQVESQSIEVNETLGETDNTENLSESKSVNPQVESQSIEDNETLGETDNTENLCESRSINSQVESQSIEDNASNNEGIHEANSVHSDDY